MFRVSLGALLLLISACSSSSETSQEMSQPPEDKSSAVPDTEPLVVLTLDAQTETSIPSIANTRAELRVLGMT